MGITDSYSGVVLNQNAMASGSYAWRDNGADWIYQTFTLPYNYTRGSSNDELTVPDLSGFQVLCGIDAGLAPSATLDYTLDYYAGVDAGWVPLTSGTVIGTHADGTSIWFDVIFDQPVPVTLPMIGEEFRIGMYGRAVTSNTTFNQLVTIAASGAYVIDAQAFDVQLMDDTPSPITINGVPAFLLKHGGEVTYSVQQGVNSLSYVTPSPLTSASTGIGQAYQADGFTPLLGEGVTAALNFRILGLVADSGTNFLNNEYRSAVIQTGAGNTSTTDGLQPTLGSAAGATYYMSPPQPSPFSVISLYFDVRPVADTPTIETVNAIGNPSFEYDAPGYVPAWWQTFNAGGIVVDQTVKSSALVSSDPNYAPWAYDGYQSLHMKYTFVASGQQLGYISPFYAVAPPLDGSASIPISAQLQYDILSRSSSNLYFSFLFYDSSQTLLPSPYGTQSFSALTLGQGEIQGSTTVPSTAAYIRYLVSAIGTGSGSFEGYVDGIQSTLTTSNVPFFDGDDLNCEWSAQRGQSPSMQIVDAGAADNSVVIDGVMVDPITPNMAFNIYYTSDDAYTSDSMTDTNWEQKLWTRVPKAYLALQRNTYAFPQPIKAKYMKLEFTNLPAQSYNPGPLQKPVAYKKFPTWVANFFLNAMEMPTFIPGQVSVQYDALAFAYDYYLDDLGQAPYSPQTPPTDLSAQLTNYFNAAPTGLDANTLAQINLDMSPFQRPISSFANTSTMLGSYVSTLTTNNSPQVSEGGIIRPVDYSTVSTLAREPVILEQSMPVMYFFLTCRHAYKELTATFEYNRAYFAGVNSVAFIRNDYTVASDTSLYIESGGDTANVQTSDWIVDQDGNWYTY